MLVLIITDIEIIESIEKRLPKDYRLVYLSKGDYTIFDNKGFIVDKMPLEIEMALNQLNELDSQSK